MTACFVASFALASCGGGGGGTGGGGGGGIGAPATVSGDMIAYQASRGWNYHGSAFGSTAVTVSVYADPPSGSSLALIMFAGVGTATTAFSGTKVAGLGLANSGSGYNATAYILLNNNGSTYAQGAIAGAPTLVPSTLVQGQSFATYPGVTATVQSVGVVPGASACPTPGTGATVLYSFDGQSYLVSYVPGCGMTNYVGNHGETLTLASVGSYPQLGTQSVRRMSTLTVLDNVASLARIIATQSRWQPFPTGS